jgi:hypothetical protein
MEEKSPRLNVAEVLLKAISCVVLFVGIYVFFKNPTFFSFEGHWLLKLGTAFLFSFIFFSCVAKITFVADVFQPLTVLIGLIAIMLLLINIIPMAITVKTSTTPSPIDPFVIFLLLLWVVIDIALFVYHFESLQRKQNTEENL